MGRQPLDRPEWAPPSFPTHSAFGRTTRTQMPTEWENLGVGRWALGGWASALDRGHHAVEALHEPEDDELDHGPPVEVGAAQGPAGQLLGHRDHPADVELGD